MTIHEIRVTGEPAYQEFYATGLAEAPMLMVRYDAGDADTPSTWHQLFLACYDAHQMYEGWATGDALSFKGRVFARVVSYEVVPAFTTGAEYREVLP